MEAAKAHVEKLETRWRALGLEPPDLWPTLDLPTSFIRTVPGAPTAFKRLILGYDLAPTTKNPLTIPIGERPNAVLSVEAAVSHEGVGPFEAFMAGKTHPVPVMEEFQASIRSLPMPRQ